MDYGCIGERLAHSFSKEIHNRLAPYNYELCEVKKEDLELFLTKKEFKAINVTIPYKQEVIPFLDFIDDNAREIGAVNTIVNKDGKLHGYNTDFLGMNALAKRMGIDFKDKKVLILGSGGTGKTAGLVALKNGAKEIITVSRSKGVTYTDAKKNHCDAQIIINTTPCGMFPNNQTNPIDIADYPETEAVLDAVYNPICTRLVRTAKDKGIKAEGGLYMLVAQAVFASKLFTDTNYDNKIIDKIFKEIYTEKQNLVLIGMPSCGKTTVGKIVAKLLGREFIDTDVLIKEKYGEISEIFKNQGEKAFRDIETETIFEASKKCGAVIATGGGAPLRKENVSELKANGRLIFIDRPLELLAPSEDRPLSQNANAIKKIYDERYSVYKEAADVIISAEESFDDVAQKIIKEMV